MVISQEIVTVVSICVSLVTGIALQTWGIIRYLMNRQDEGDNGLHQRISKLRDETISRDEYNKDLRKVHGDLTRMERSFNEQGRAMMERLDRLIFTINPSMGYPTNIHNPPHPSENSEERED